MSGEIKSFAMKTGAENPNWDGWDCLWLSWQVEMSQNVSQGE